MKSFAYVLVIRAEDQEQADKVASARLDHDEDLRQDGVEDYEIIRESRGEIGQVATTERS